jgi:hypothetical protein
MHAPVPPDHRPATYHPGAAHPGPGYPGGGYEPEAAPAYPADRGYPARPGTALEPAYLRDPAYPQHAYAGERGYPGDGGNLPVPYRPGAQRGPGTALDDGLSRTPARTGRLTWADEQPALESGGAGPAGPAPRRRGRTVAVTMAIVLVLIGATSIAVFWLNQRRATDAAAPQPTQSVDTRSIADRKVDPAPLTTNEVFGRAKISSTAQGGGVYPVMGTDINKSCAGAVTDQISLLMTSLGCSQVVRGTMFSPDKAYVITAGVFNLPDSAAATRAFNSVKTDIGAGKGRFTGLAAGSGTDIVTSAQAKLAWEARGHYLTYCVIVLANGKPIPADDSRASLIVTDVLERYLGDTVLGARDKHTVVLPSPSGSHS